LPNKVKPPTARERRRQKIADFHNALLSHSTVAGAARATGISARTATVWLKSPEFKEIYVESRRATLEASAGLLRACASGSIQALSEIVNDREAASTARVQAAGRILDAMLRLTEAAELDKRLEALEAAAERAERGE
jgi:hypothetical protein